MLGEQSVWWFQRRTKALVTSDCNGLVKMDLVIWLIPLYAPKKLRSQMTVTTMTMYKIGSLWLVLVDP